MAKKRKKSSAFNNITIKPKIYKKVEVKKEDVVENSSLPSMSKIPSFEPVVWRSNFDFLKNHDAIFFKLISVAEEFYRIDPNTTVVKVRQFAEAMAKDIASKLGIASYEYSNQNDLIRILSYRLKLDYVIKELFHTIRKRGNEAVHEYETTLQSAMVILRKAHQLAIWYHRTFGENEHYQERAFVTPYDTKSKLEDIETQKETYHKLLEDKNSELHAIREKFETKLKQLSSAPSSKEEDKKLQEYYRAKSKRTASKIKLTEEETREIIDAKLRDAGWEADSKTLDYRKGTRPEVGRNMAIAEWACYNPHTKSNTRADYVLFIGLKAVGVVEAKKFDNDVADDIRQAQEYSRDIDLSTVVEIAKREEVILELKEWMIADDSKESYAVPFAFATNGREFQHQFKTKSGIWFRDLRNSRNKARPLLAWHTPEDLEALLLKDRDEVVKKLHADEQWASLGLREYQKEAVVKVEEAIVSEQRAILLAMATGTGKTRTIIALMYRLLKAGVFKRILFLVDRSSLGTQAQDAFAEMRPEGNFSFSEIYDVKELTDKEPDSKTRVHVATVQAMVKRVIDVEESIPVGRYDCIVVDEDHRGYTLDATMTEGEMELRSLNDYVSSYRRVLDYFDAVRIGLTATPAKHTSEIFGRPIFTYSYREAVLDGYLVDSEPPYNFETALSKNGISFEKESEIEVVNVLGEVRTELLKDELDFEVEQFNKSVLNENFNRIICEELAENYLSPMDEGKTLIFCVSDIHADLVVGEMQKAFDKIYGEQENDLVMKITGSIRDPQEAIRKYKNERLPNVVVTVDLLTTGVDVPTISNIVFLRRVRSRILYEQMKGRATRLCPEIDKDVFCIFDAVGLHKVLEKVDTMKPVVQRVDVSIEQLIEELNEDISYASSGDALGGDSERTHAEDVKEQLIVKLHNISRRVENIEKNPEAKEPLTMINTLLDNEFNIELKELAGTLKEMSAKDVGSFFNKISSFVPLMRDLREGLNINKSDMVISNHDDEMISITRGYGQDANGEPITAPEDYLESFETFIKENINEMIALKAVVERPRDLTRKDLKELKLKLAEFHFNENILHTAWKASKNEDIGATIIGYIRSLALGVELVPYEQRVDNALKKIKSSGSWSRNQERWLERLAKQLKANVILDDESFNSSPFKEQGGKEMIDRQLGNKLDTILNNFSAYMWEERA